jgi:hypothetical protein
MASVVFCALSIYAARLAVACRLLTAACFPLHGAPCLDGCPLHGACWLDGCLLHAVCRLLHVVCCMGCVAYCIVSRCMLHVAWCPSRCVLHICKWSLARCPLRVVCGIADRWTVSAAHSLSHIARLHVVACCISHDCTVLSVVICLLHVVPCVSSAALLSVGRMPFVARCRVAQRRRTRSASRRRSQLSASVAGEARCKP